MNTSLYPTPALIELVRPFVGARLNPKAHPHTTAGGYLQPLRGIDIAERSNRINADVRSVSAEGIEVFFYRGCDFIPWSDVRYIVLVGFDEEGRRNSERLFEHDLRKAAA